MNKKIIKVKSDIEFVKTTCEIIKEQACKNIESKNSFTFVLSGGRTPKSIFDELIANYQESINWSKVHIFWVDERCVEPSSESSNFKLAVDSLISKLGVIGSVHRMKGELEPIKAANEYRKNIEFFFASDEIKFDFMLLGMGEDGHVASLFPDSREIGLKNDLVLATEKIYNGFRRISLGLNLINNSKYNLLLVNGAEKINILKSNNNKYPINQIKDKNIIILDKPNETTV